jgi:hypothetical protein
LILHDKKFPLAAVLETCGNHRAAGPEQKVLEEGMQTEIWAVKCDMKSELSGQGF